MIDYTKCLAQAPNNTGFEPIPSNLVSSSFKAPAASDKCPAGTGPRWSGNTTQITYQPGTTPVDTHICSVQFNIPANLNPPVLLYYRLTNFYQNHRRYVKSLDSDQLKGTAVSEQSTGACDPLQKNPTNNKTYYPCGLIANSQFNDTFSQPLQLNLHYNNDGNQTYNMIQKGIAWSSDTEKLYGKTQYDFSQISPPPNWFLRYQNGYDNASVVPNLQTDEAFQVWMRTAGLPSFSKLALRNDNETMQCSTYQIDITNSMFTSRHASTTRSD